MNSLLGGSITHKLIRTVPHLHLKSGKYRSPILQGISTNRYFRFADKKPPSSKSIRTRVLTKRTGQTEVVGSVQFHCRPTADLIAKGFTDVPLYYPTAASPPGSPNTAKSTPNIGTSKGKSKWQPSGKKPERAKSP